MTRIMKCFYKHKIVLVVLLSLSFQSCDYNLSSSKSIDDAKRKGVFVREYIVVKSETYLPQSTNFGIKEVWLESLFYSRRFLGSIKKTEKYSLRFNTENELKQFRTRQWQIGKNIEKNIRVAGKKAFISNFEFFPVQDTIVYDIIESDNLQANFNGKYKIVGKLTLAKKK